ncbi:DsbA family protein [Spirosoma soli]|uniref:DsbA family protein n=1 Tax=Spirosoma soli TaxID=1770529 RepID=A0ABW5M8E7_9BACT
MASLPNMFPLATRVGEGTVELMEFGNFACHQCRQTRALVYSVRNEYSHQVCYSFRHFPNPLHASSMLASLAAEAARRQGYFWPMYQALFTLPVMTHGAVTELASDLGLDHNQFVTDLASEQLRLTLDEDQREGQRLGVMKTPTLFVAGQQFHGKWTPSRLLPIIRAQLSRVAQPLLSRVDPANGVIYWGKEA